MSTTATISFSLTERVVAAMRYFLVTGRWHPEDFSEADHAKMADLTREEWEGLALSHLGRTDAQQLAARIEQEGFDPWA